MLGKRGVRMGWLATSVRFTPVRLAARKRISRTGPGQASASTQMVWGFGGGGMGISQLACGGVSGAALQGWCGVEQRYGHKC